MSVAGGFPWADYINKYDIESLFIISFNMTALPIISSSHIGGNIMLQTQTENNNIENLHNKQILDEDGYLVDPADWTQSFTERRAEEAGVELVAEHWHLIEIIRDKYMRLGALPPMRSVCKSVGLDKRVLKQQFGSCLNLWKMAGLPNPGAEAIAYMN
jgi:dissimilatory sulfite reductase related protein